MRSLKVASTSKPPAVAGAIAWTLRDGVPVEIVGIGAAAVNQAVKAIAIARSYLALEGIDLFAVPEFITVNKPEQEEGRTAIRIVVEPRAAVTANEEQEQPLELAAGR